MQVWSEEAVIYALVWPVHISVTANDWIFQTGLFPNPFL